MALILQNLRLVEPLRGSIIGTGGMISARHSAARTLNPMAYRTFSPRARTQPIPLSFIQRSPGHAPPGSEFFDARQTAEGVLRTGAAPEGYRRGDSDIGGTEASAGAGVFFVTLVFLLLARLLLRKGKGNSRGTWRNVRKGCRDCVRVLDTGRENCGHGKQVLFVSPLLASKFGKREKGDIIQEVPDGGYIPLSCP